MSEQTPALGYEISVRYEVERTPTAEQMVALRERLQGIAVRSFQVRFPSVEPVLEVSVEDGSVWVKIRQRAVAVGLMLNAVVIGAKNYSEARDGIVTVAGDVVAIVEYTGTAIRKAVDESCGITAETRKRTEIGCVAELDLLMTKYKSGQMTFDDFVLKSEAIFVAINASPDRASLISALTAYISKVYGGNFFERLAKQLPPSSPLPPPDQPGPGPRTPAMRPGGKSKNEDDQSPPDPSSDAFKRNMRALDELSKKGKDPFDFDKPTA